jgi:hypothetical protein
MKSIPSLLNFVQGFRQSSPKLTLISAAICIASELKPTKSYTVAVVHPRGAQSDREEPKTQLDPP